MKMLLPMHRYLPPMEMATAASLERTGELEAGELVVLIGIEDLEPAVSSQHLVDTEPGIWVFNSHQASTCRSCA